MSVKAQDVDDFINKVIRESLSGVTTEHSFRGFFKPLFESVDNIEAINEPTRSEHGAPDYVFLNKNNREIIRGYAEMKDLNKNLDEIEKTDQIDRYKGYENIILTNNLDWRFFRNGEKYFEIKIGEYNAKEKKITGIYKANYERLADEINAFFELTPERIRSGARLAEIMGGKARRIRDQVDAIINNNVDSKIVKRDEDIEAIYQMMRQLLVSDLKRDAFADMYAQTLVYGLFVARYNDSTPEDFTRIEARELVPATNPFLREFFNHIAGPNFNKGLSYIVDELCDIFAVSDIKDIVHKHLRITENCDTEAKDPIIHFYEDFLAAYDSELRKKMGAYYTPIPVVRYIILMVDKVLKEDFGISDGISSNEKVKYTHRVDQYFDSARGRAKHERTEEIPRVQILDPAVGTATFLNEIVKYIYENKFKKNAGAWPSYVNDNILPRLNGFELMMTPYTIAHLKLGMTLSELGAKNLNDRLRIFLTNTLTEGEEKELPLFAFGLQKVVTEESNYASEVKNDLPVMVVIGNPPYSVSSSNKSKYIEALISDYKKDLDERNIQPLSDDYIKFIRFSESMVEKNGCGVVAMITNNSYVDGIIHRRMREHLLKTFNKIYVLNLHGNSRKKETSPDGSPDQNVFDIMQGVSIIVAVKNDSRSGMGKVYYADLYGTRKYKFEILNIANIDYQQVDIRKPDYLFCTKDNKYSSEYEQGIRITDLFDSSTVGIVTGKDSVFVGNSDEEIFEKMKNFRINGNGEAKQRLLLSLFSDEFYQNIAFRPFDVRRVYYDKNVMNRARYNVMRFVDDISPILVTERAIDCKDGRYHGSFVTNAIVDKHLCGGASYAFPLYRCYEDGTKIPNFNPEFYREFIKNIGEQAPEDILGYCYAILNSPSFCKKFRVSLCADFPRIPIPLKRDFSRLASLGKELYKTQLSFDSIKPVTTYPENGNNVIDKVKYCDNKVWINDTQYFDNVSELAWNFYIGGYQPAQKWLKDRKGRELSFEDIEHYGKIITILNETDRIMKEIG